jgi:hypothetical protein
MIDLLKSKKAIALVGDGLLVEHDFAGYITRSIYAVAAAAAGQ